MTADLLIAGWVFGFGLVLGSFLNVCIYRLPKALSIVWPGSSCPACRHPIAWHDNIPVLSYLFLGCKCRFCKAPISARYPLVEMLTGFLFLLIYLRFQGSWIWMVLGWILAAALVVSTFIDFDCYIIPDFITLPGIPLGFFAHFVFPHLSAPEHSRWQALLWSVQGAVAGGGLLWLVALIGRWVYRKEVMGMGDVKLMAMVGALLGWQNALLGIFFGSLTGSIAGIFLILTKKSKWQSRIPFGPYLSLGTLIAFLAGQPLVAWYLKMLVSLCK